MKRVMRIGDGLEGVPLCSTVCAFSHPADLVSEQWAAALASTAAREAMIRLRIEERCFDGIDYWLRSALRDISPNARHGLAPAETRLTDNRRVSPPAAPDSAQISGRGADSVCRA